MHISDIADTKASAMGEYLQNLLGMDAEEKIIYMTTTVDYSGFLVFFFENGKGVKVQLSAYATKTNRRKLVNAYASRSPLIFMQKLEEDTDFVLLRNYDKATVLHTSLLPSTTTKNAAGVQLFTLKKNSMVTQVIPASGFVTDDLEYYRTQKIPTAGHFIQEKDKQNNQIPGQMEL